MRRPDRRNLGGAVGGKTQGRRDGGGLPDGVCMRGGVDGGGRHLYAEERDGVEH